VLFRSSGAGTRYPQRHLGKVISASNMHNPRDVLGCVMNPKDAIFRPAYFRETPISAYDVFSAS